VPLGRMRTVEEGRSAGKVENGYPIRPIIRTLPPTRAERLREEITAHLLR